MGSVLRYLPSKHENSFVARRRLLHVAIIVFAEEGGVFVQPALVVRFPVGHREAVKAAFVFTRGFTLLQRHVGEGRRGLRDLAGGNGQPHHVVIKGIAGRECGPGYRGVRVLLAWSLRGPFLATRCQQQRQ